MIQNLIKYTVQEKISVRDVIKHMSESHIEICVCVNDIHQVVGVFTEGDFRRAIFEGMQLDDDVGALLNDKYIYVSKDYQEYEVEKIFNETIVEQIPVLDNGYLIDIIIKDEYFKSKENKNLGKLNNLVIIMAGGKGTRLDPFTRILPKPLIPFGDDPVIKTIMDKFGRCGMRNFKISVNEKSRMIKAYFNDHELPYSIEYIEEDKPLGTIGAVKMIEGNITEPFFVTNCDIILNTNYASVMDFHLKENNDLTLIGALHNLIIPYGVCEIESNGHLIKLNEKPNYDYLVNTGVYLLNPELLQYIPDNEHFDITDLLEKLRLKKKKIGVYPITEHDWVDIGQWTEYHNAINKIDELKIVKR